LWALDTRSLIVCRDRHSGLLIFFLKRDAGLTRQ
jgi:hypothetical protein